MIRPGCMASTAGCDPRQQHIARFRASQRLRMATHASEAGVRPVIEFRMRHPSRRGVRGHNFRKRFLYKAIVAWRAQPGRKVRQLVWITLVSKCERVTLSAG